MPVRYTNPRNVLQKAMQLIIYPTLYAGLLIKDSLSFLKCRKCEKTLKVVTHKRH